MKMDAVHVVCAFVLLLSCAQYVQAQCLSEQLAAPAPGQNYTQYISWLTTFRETMLNNIDYSGDLYDDLAWVRRQYIQPQAMAHDRYLYDPVLNEWTIDRYLDDVTVRYGGIDALLIWPTYPNIGVDDRNQFELIRGMGGGDSLNEMVAAFHAKGVRVLFPYNPWDVGTRRDPAGDAATLAQLINDCNADGFNGDTMAGIPQVFQQEAQKRGYPIMLQPEVGMPNTDYSFLQYDVPTRSDDHILPALSHIVWSMTIVATWGYWQYGQMPTLSKYKWIEPKHMINICNRWSNNHTQDLQNAYFNGVGFESWENVWSFWNGMTDYDMEAVRRVSAILRFFSAYFSSPQWMPYYPTLQSSVYCSLFPSVNTSSALFLFVERNNINVTGAQLWLPLEWANLKFYDAYHGTTLVPTKNSTDGSITLSFWIENNGYGAVFATAALTPDLKEFLVNMSELTASPLASYSSAWAPLLQNFTMWPQTPLANGTPSGMVRIPGGLYQFINSGVMIEGSDLPGIDVQYPGESYPTRNHNLQINVTSFYMDLVPVSNVAFATFLNATSYAPSDAYNFLRDWDNNGSFPHGWEKKPVTWVSVQDSVAKRLPHDWEWQYAAQGGNSSLLYPWGMTWNPSCVPTPDYGPSMSGPDVSDAHPCGAQISNGLLDLVGNVWQWTDEVTDEHTQSQIVRGGSYYQPQVAWDQNWYFPQAYALNQHGKYLRMCPSLDRSGAIGFRCVKDAGA